VDESNTSNNHATSYDVQILSIGMFLGRTDWAREWLEARTIPRIEQQIEPDGAMPRELERTKSWNYTTGNIKHFFDLAIIAKRFGIDLFHFPSTDDPRIKTALDFALPYVDKPEDWKYTQIKEWKPTLLRRPLIIAAENED